MYLVRICIILLFLYFYYVYCCFCCSYNIILIYVGKTEQQKRATITEQCSVLLLYTNQKTNLTRYGLIFKYIGFGLPEDHIRAFILNFCSN